MTFVGIDVGGTKCHGVRIDADGGVIAETKHPTPHASELTALLEKMFGELGGGSSLGVGVPGLITPDGVIKASPNMKGAHDITVGPSLRRSLGIHVHVENDATATAYGEWRAGAARGATNALIVTLGTGIGGGLVVGGELQRGANGFAGEIGHMVVDANGVECVCGRRGCWERYASGSALRMLSGGLSGEEVVARASSGDEHANGVIDEFARWIAVGLASLTNILDPEVIVLGGGVVDAWDVYGPVLRNWMNELLYSPAARPHPLLAPATLGPRAGAVGAGLIAAHA